MKHFAIPSHCVQIALVRLLTWWFLAGFTILLFLFPKGIMPYCYPAPEHFPRWCQVSTQHSPCQKSSFPALCWVHCHVTDNYFIWYLSTCSQTGILYLQNCLLGTILCWLCSPFSLSGRNEWGGKETTSSVSSHCSQKWAGKLSRKISCTAGALDSRRAALRAQHRGRQVAGEKVLESLCISLAAVEGVKPPVKAPSSSQGTASSLQDMLHSLC